MGHSMLPLVLHEIPPQITRVVPQSGVATRPGHRQGRLRCQQSPHAIIHGSVGETDGTPASPRSRSFLISARFGPVTVGQAGRRGIAQTVRTSWRFLRPHIPRPTAPEPGPAESRPSVAHKFGLHSMYRPAPARRVPARVALPMERMLALARA